MTNNRLAYAEGHAERLKAALIKREYLNSEGADLPPPLDIPPSPSGRSTVYFLRIPGEDHPLEKTSLIFAKFVDPSDWEEEHKSVKVLDQMLRTYNLDRSIIVPFVDDREMILISPAAEDLANCPSMKSLMSCLCDELEANPKKTTTCIDALQKTIAVINNLHKKLPIVRDKDYWYAKFTEKIQKKLDRKLSIKSGSIDQIMDQFDRYAAMPDGTRRTAIHGDTNLTNEQVAIGKENEPADVFLIDFANVQFNMPSAIDYARLEAEIWREVFYKVTKEKIENSWQFLRAAVEYLDGRRAFEEIGKVNEESNDEQIAENLETLRPYIDIVATIRAEVASILREGRKNYLLEDYLRALYLQHLKALTFGPVLKNPVKIEIAYMGASVAIETLDALTNGRYSSTEEKPFESPVVRAEDWRDNEADERARWIERITDRFAEKLERNPNALEAFAVPLGIDDDPTPRDVAKKLLLYRNLYDFLVVCERAQLHTINNGDDSAESVVIEIVNEALPAICESRHISVIYTDKFLGIVLSRIQTSAPTVAEIILASRRRRSTRWGRIDPIKKKDKLRGSGQTPFAPPAGFSGGCTHIIELIGRDLAREFGIEEGEDYNKGDTNERDALINEELKTARDIKRSIEAITPRYVVLGRFNSTTSGCESFVRALKSRYPELEIFELGMSVDGDRSIMRLLREMLLRYQGKGPKK